MKTTIEFNLPEDEAEYNFAINGFQYYNALDDIREYLRQKVKYGQETKKDWKTYNDIYEKFFEILKDNKIDLE